MGVGRGRLQAARHLRLPVRADEGDARRGGAVGRRPGLRGADGARRAASRAPGAQTAGGDEHHKVRHVRAGRRLRDALRRLRDDGVGDGHPRARARRTAGCLRSSRRARSTPRAAARSSDSGVVETDSGRAVVADVFRLGDDQAVELEQLEGEPGRGPAGARCGGPREPPGDDAQPHRHPPAARVAARAARPARPPGRLVRRPGQAAVRLHARRAALEAGAGRRRGGGERLDRREPPGAGGAHDARRGGAARCDGALRREVRRLGADGRRGRGVARAVRRHPRRLDRRDRPVPRDPGDVQRVERAPHRGADRPPAASRSSAAGPRTCASSRRSCACPSTRWSTRCGRCRRR